MKYPIGYTFALCIPFHLLQCWCNTCTNHITNDMIHFILSRDLVGSRFIDLDLTCSSPLPSSIDAKSCSSFTVRWSIAPKPPTCPSHLQPVHQAKSCLDLLHLIHMNPCHISYVMSSFMCEPYKISKSFHLYGIDCSHMMYLWTNHLCISLKHILVHLRLSLNYQNQTTTFQSHQALFFSFSRSRLIVKHLRTMQKSSSAIPSREPSLTRLCLQFSSAVRSPFPPLSSRASLKSIHVTVSSSHRRPCRPPRWPCSPAA
jgi:hypothetical protein